MLLTVLCALPAAPPPPPPGAVACIDFCLASGADVISASWSAGSEPNPALEEAVRRTASAGVLFVAAAGEPGEVEGGRR